MRTTLRRLGRTLPAGSAMLILAACGGGSSTPTAPVEVVAATKATEPAAATVPVSVTVRGSVVDSSNRQVANATIECLGDVSCNLPGSEVSAEGHEHHAGTTDPNGSYEIVATGRSAGPGSGFLMNANGRGYQVDWQQVNWPHPACTAAEARCAITVNFRLAPVTD